MAFNKIASILILSWLSFAQAAPFPIGFSIPEEKIVEKIPQKDRDFASLIPGHLDTYIYRRESDYYEGYQRAYYAITCKKQGWDCLRHYEILANGTIPYFIDLDFCDENTLHFFPKELIKEAMNLEGVSYMHIDHDRFDPEKYNAVLTKLLDYTKEHLTSREMAYYLLNKLQYNWGGKVLFLSEDLAPDYLRCLTLIGLKQVLGEQLIDVPKVPHLYKSYMGNIEDLYGLGMTYTKILDDLPVDRSNIAERIINKEFDLIIYGSVHRGTPFIYLVKKFYEPDQIAYLCGEDCHDCAFKDYHNLFLREFQ